MVVRHLIATFTPNAQRTAQANTAEELAVLVRRGATDRWTALPLYSGNPDGRLDSPQLLWIKIAPGVGYRHLAQILSPVSTDDGRYGVRYLSESSRQLAAMKLGHSAIGQATSTGPAFAVQGLADVEKLYESLREPIDRELAWDREAVEDLAEESASLRERRRDAASRLERDPAFRRSVLNRLGAKCHATGTTLEVVLEAAHILPVDQENDDDPRNGLVLRRDIHRLFDLLLLSVDENLCWRVSPELEGTAYGQLAGKPLLFGTELRPDQERLRKHATVWLRAQSR